MAKKAAIKYRSLRSNLVHLPLSLFASLAQQQARPQGLILHLSPLLTPSTSSRPPQSAYLGWSGLAAASSLSGISGDVETLEIDPEVALGLGWAEGTLVEISIIHNPVRARNVTVTPVSSDDWEILEQHAEYLENNLLGQMRAAQKGKEVGVWVGKVKIRIRIDETTPPTTETSAVLLNIDTEIYVTPRPRQAIKANGSAKTPQATSQDTAPTSLSGKNGSSGSRSRTVPTARLVPPRLAKSWSIHAEPNSANGSTNSGRSKIGKGTERIEAFVSPRDMQRWSKRLGLKDASKTAVRLRQLDSVSTEPSSEVQAGQGEDGQGKAQVLDVLLRRSDEVPPGHIVLLEDYEGWTEWTQIEIVQATSPLPESPKRIESPDPPQQRLAGVDGTIAKCLDYLTLSALQSESCSVSPLLLTGSKGSGRTSIAKRVADLLEGDRETLAEPFYVDVARVELEGRVNKTKETMTAWLDDASKRAPCLVILDGLDTLLMPEQELNTTTSSNNATLADHFVQTFADPPPGVYVLATALSAQSLHPLLNTKHAFGESIKIPAATKEIRAKILHQLIEDLPSVPVQSALSNKANGAHYANGLETEHKVLDYVTLASMTDGYMATDMKDLVGGALQQAIMRVSRTGEGKVDLTLQDFVEAQAAFTPLNLRGVALQKSDTQWSDIGGLREVRRVLRETLEWPTKYAQIFANCPLRLRSGLLLYGYPGCGKTLLASAVAKECGLNFISVKGPEILNKYIGASEKSVRDLFERASAAKPCVLFFDEFESIAPKRGHDSTGVTDRVVNQLLTEMDGAQGLDGVYVLAATSRPDLIDPALLRPGRLDKALLCDIPDEEDRLDILKAVAKKLPFEADIDFAAVARQTAGFSGADLQAVVYNAHLEVVHDQISAA